MSIHNRIQCLCNSRSSSTVCKSKSQQFRSVFLCIHEDNDRHNCVCQMNRLPRVYMDLLRNNHALSNRLHDVLYNKNTQHAHQLLGMFHNDDKSDQYMLRTSKSHNLFPSSLACINIYNFQLCSRKRHRCKSYEDIRLRPVDI